MFDIASFTLDRSLAGEWARTAISIKLRSGAELLLRSSSRSTRVAKLNDDGSFHISSASGRNCALRTDVVWPTPTQLAILHTGELKAANRNFSNLLTVQVSSDFECKLLDGYRRAYSLSEIVSELIQAHSGNFV